MKACPFCAERIQDAAVFCRYCRKDLPAVHPADAIMARSAAGVNGAAPRIRGMARVLVLAYAGLTASLACVLLILAFAGSVGPLPAIAQAALWFAISYALVVRDRRASLLLWVLVAVSGIGVLARGLRPIEILVWLVNVAFARWYSKREMATVPPTSEAEPIPHEGGR